MKKITDERILNGKRKINSSAFGLLLLGLWGIVLYRQLILQQPIGEFVDVYLLTTGISLYVFIGNVLNGYYLTYRNKSSKVKTLLIGGIVGTIIFTLVQYFMMDTDLSLVSILELILKGVIFLAVWLIIQFWVLKASERQSNKDID